MNSKPYSAKNPEGRRSATSIFNVEGFEFVGQLADGSLKKMTVVHNARWGTFSVKGHNKAKIMGWWPMDIAGPFLPSCAELPHPALT